MRPSCDENLTHIPANSGALLAQDTVAPTTGEKVGPVRGENTGDYNVVQSWEFGYRFASIGGSQDEYRSDVNYTDGFRLLSSSLDGQFEGWSRPVVRRDRADDAGSGERSV
jgi:hypothetical protein